MSLRVAVFREGEDSEVELLVATEKRSDTGLDARHDWEMANRLGEQDLLFGDKFHHSLKLGSIDVAPNTYIQVVGRTVEIYILHDSPDRGCSKQ